MEVTSERWSSSRWFIGSVLIALGVLFFLMNVGVIEYFHIWEFWPVILMVIGANKFFQPYQRAEGFWLIALGAWLQWSLLRIYGYGFRDTWPAVIILFGIYLLWESIDREFRRKKAQEQFQTNSTL